MVNSPGRFRIAERLDANYIASDGSKKRHGYVALSNTRIYGAVDWYTYRAVCRQIPDIVAPVQAVITTITGDNDDYAYKVLEECKKVGLRAAVDVRNEKINYKIREHSNAKIR